MTQTSADPAATPSSPRNALHLIHLSLQKGCSSVVYPAESDEKPKKSTISRSSSSTPSSPSGSPHCKPHKSNDEVWEMIQSIKSQDGSLDLNQFQLLARLGEGDIGAVFLAKLATSSNTYHFAVKCMDKQRLKSKNKLQRVEIEREVLEMLDHPFLPTLYGFFENSEYSCLVMEFCPGGDLHKFRQRQPSQRFDEDAVRFYAAEVILALEYLHMMGVVYRDLKPENVLLREDGHIMLTDFDLSLRFDANPKVLKPLRNFRPSCILPGQPQQCQVVSCSLGSPTSLLRRNGSLVSSKKQGKVLRRTSSSLPQLNVEPLNLRSMSFVGTHEYLAPEIIAGGGHGSAVDWWTLGIFIYELMFGVTPFKGADNDTTLVNAFSKQLTFPANVEVSQEAKDLLKCLIVKDPRRRLGSARGASDIKAHPFFEDINWALIRCNVPPEVPKKYNFQAVTAAAEEAAAKLAENRFECF